LPPRTLRALAAGAAAWALLVGAACDSDTEEPSSTAGGSGGGAETQPTEATTPLPSEGGTATPGSEATISLDPCALVTREEAAAALGEPVTEGEPSLVGDIETCTYSPEAGGGIGSVQVAYLTRGVSTDEFPGVISEGAEVDLDPIAQIGDAAFWDGDQVVVRVGDVALSAIVIPTEGGGSTAVDREASTGLARLAAERVP